MMKRTTCILTMVGIWVAAARAEAQTFPTTDPRFENPAPQLAGDGEIFGQKGQLVLTSAFDFDFLYESRSLNGKSDSRTRLDISPALDFFVAPNVTLGGRVALERTSSSGAVDTLFSVGPQVGYVIMLAPKVSMWPRAGVGYQHASQSTESQAGGVTGKTTLSGYSVNVALSAPVLFHPFPHFFLGIGPLIRLDLVSKLDGKDYAKTKQFGVLFDLGAWL